MEEVASATSPVEIPPSSGTAPDSLFDIFSQPVTGSSVSVVCPTRSPENGSSASPAAGPSGTTCDFRGNRLYTAVKAWYLVLRIPDVGPEPGLYYGTWPQLTSAYLPDKKLPQTGYGYRKVASQEDPAAEKARRNQGHRRAIPAFQL